MAARWRRVRQATSSNQAAVATKAMAKELGVNFRSTSGPVIAKAGTIAQGATPIAIAWDYNALAWKDTLAFCEAIITSVMSTPATPRS